MSLWQRFWPFGRKSASLGNSTLDFFRDIFGWRSSKSGQQVNWQTALQVSCVLACTRVIAEGVAMLPFKLYQQKDRVRTVATDHDLNRVVSRAPNEWQTAFEFREQLTMHAVLTGDGFALTNRVRGTVREFLPLLPTWVIARRDENWNVYYEVRINNRDMIIVPRANMFHLRGPSWDGFRGLEMVKIAREAIGLALALEESHASLHRNGARTGGVLSIEGSLDDVNYKKLKAWIKEHYAGAENAGETMIVDRSAKFTPTVQSGVDSQHLETRKFQIEEVCRHMRVFPQMVGHSDKTATFASAESFFLAHVTHTLQPWLTRWEQAMERDALSANDVRDGYYLKFSVQALLRGDAASRSKFYQSGILTGWMTRNEARDLEEFNPIDGLDEPLTPVNMHIGDEPPADVKPQPSGA